MRKFRKEKYGMDIETANQTLQSVFAACNQAPNKIPFERIVLQKKAKTASVRICMWICILFLIAAVFSPSLFINHYFKISNTNSRMKPIIIEDHSYENDCFTIKFKGDNIDYDGIYLIDESGTTSVPDEIISSEGIVQINHPSGTINIFVPDYDGNTLHAVLSIDEED